MVEDHVAPAYASAEKRDGVMELNKFLATDNRIEISHVPLGDGIICRRIQGIFTDVWLLANKV
ncbi:caffeoyl-CoA O-methyltransferase-like [Tripterygium wilfordii]|uniref:Caffeoyl-CoA O-methyltransferase-like n=1 Tax=Tripterygium wilfordii TaxID=458696 RepID=A0A7J7C6G7_TRIWF|nr:caffeoyl-CoA O-methyltransferase-like [Tripterygium wilfordii]